jgi:HD-GYP domain-containing protein (c-di-GMP phosphodiesterase class II)
MRFIPVEKVVQGQVLARDVFDEFGRVLLKHGNALSDKNIKRIMEAGVYSVYVQEEHTEEVIDDVLRIDTRRNAVNSMRDTFHKFIKQENEAKSSLVDPNTINIKKVDMQNKEILSLDNVSRTLVDDIIGHKDIMISLVDIKSVKEHTFQHSINVAALSIVMGIELGMNEKDLNQIALGAIIHDLGKAFITEEETLNDPLLHVLKGYEYIKSNTMIPPQSKLVLVQHHERMDGLGGPMKTSIEKIHQFAKIVAIANKFDNLISDTKTYRGIPVNEAVEFIMGNGGSMFDLKLVEAFVNTVIPYPIGTHVILNNGLVGVVMRINRNYPLRPVLKIISTDVAIEIDLMVQRNLVIEKISYDR